jgi:5-methylthioadenosine/S-adenosylhomocysteine deaminase
LPIVSVRSGWTRRTAALPFPASRRWRVSCKPAALPVGDSRDILVPGLVNAHDHLSEGLISGIGETMSLYEWQERLIRPAGPHLSREMARAGTLLKGAEMIRSGITCVNDMFVHAT